MKHSLDRDLGEKMYFINNNEICVRDYLQVYLQVAHTLTRLTRLTIRFGRILIIGTMRLCDTSRARELVIDNN